MGGEGRAVGAGVAVTGDPLQGQVLRVGRQTHRAQHARDAPTSSTRVGANGGRDGGMEEEAGSRWEDGGSDGAEHRRDSSERQEK